jgi:hypothetical protein
LLNNALPDEANMNRHIYITSDETIKEGDWVFDSTNYGLIHKVWEVTETHFSFKDSLHARGLKSTNKNLKAHFKKISLTTDQELIADGVQGIDNEFLEWFVKNPTCESVEVDLDYECALRIIDGKNLGYYSVIIPKEEPNPFELPKALPDDIFYRSLESKQDNCCTPIGQIKRYVDCVGCDGKPSKKDTLKEAVQKLSENAAIKYADTQSDISMRESHLEYSKSGRELWEEAKTDFIEGASWQAEITVDIAIKFAEFCRNNASREGTYGSGFTNNWELKSEQKIVTTEELFKIFIRTYGKE